LWVAAAAIGTALLEGAPRSAEAFRFMLALFILPAFPFYYFARKLTAPSAADKLGKDKRLPVLYLREFRSDSDAIGRRWLSVSLAFADFRKNTDASDEDHAVRVLQRIGSVIAIGRPGEGMAALGAARMYVDDAHWQQVVAGVAAEAAFTVIRLGETEGLRWELEHAVRNLPPERILIYVPRSVKAAAYDAFRALANKLLPRPLPTLTGKPRFIRFDTAWRACFMGDDALLLFDARPPVFLVDTRTEDRGRLADTKALAVVFSEIGPVIALVPPDSEPPARCAGWMEADEQTLLGTVQGETWRHAPLVVAAGGNHRFGDLLRRLAETTDARRVVLHIPKGRDEAGIRDEMARHLPAIVPTRLARFVIFDRAWRPQLLQPRRTANAYELYVANLESGYPRHGAVHSSGRHCR
jgi:hypothetical protein